MDPIEKDIIMNTKRFNNTYLNAFSKNWAWFLIWGIALVVLGVIAISATLATTVISVIFLGFLLLIAGILMVVDACSFWWHKWGGFLLHLILGILYLFVGIMLVQSPILASISLTLFLGIFYFIIGLFRLIYSLTLRTPNWGWSLFNAVISLLLGILILTSWPQSGLFIIGLFVGIDLLFTGWAYIMVSLAGRFSGK
jgi:uncharacterized membrane protein HdeD (DUF308 family)